MDVHFYLGSNKVSCVSQEVLGMYSMNILYNISDLSESKDLEESDSEDENPAQPPEKVIGVIKKKYQEIIKKITNTIGDVADESVFLNFLIENIEIQYFIHHQTEPFNVITLNKNIKIRNDANHFLRYRKEGGVLTAMRNFIISLKKDRSCILDFCGIIMDYNAETKIWMNYYSPVLGMKMTYILSEEDRNQFVHAMYKLFSHINDLVGILHNVVKTSYDKSIKDILLKAEECASLLKSDK